MDTSMDLQLLVKALPTLRTDRNWNPELDMKVRCRLAARWCRRWLGEIPLAEERAVLERLHRYLLEVAQRIDSVGARTARTAVLNALHRAPDAIYRNYQPVMEHLMPSRLEWSPESSVLLVSKQPGPVELRTGIAFCDTRTLVYTSRCGHCISFLRCYSHPTATSCTGHRSAGHRQESDRWYQQGNQVHNAGDELAPLLQAAGMWRPVWGTPNHEVEGLVQVAITNVFRLPVQPNGNGQSDTDHAGESPDPHSLSGAPIWLLALEALFVAPVATVALGYDATLAIQKLSTGANIHFATTPIAFCPPFGYVIPAYQPVQLVRAENEVQRALIRESVKNALRKAANIARQGSQHPYATARDLFGIGEYQRAPSEAVREVGAAGAAISSAEVD